MKMILKQQLGITMLDTLLQHSSIGTQPQIAYILKLLSENDCFLEDLKYACISREYSFGASFNGIICLLQWLDIIKVTDFITLQNNIKQKNFTQDICTILFSKLAQSNELHNFINDENLIFNKDIYVKNNLVKLKFSPIRNFLLGLGLFKNDDLIQNQFIINQNCIEWFYDVVIPLIEKSQIKSHTLQSLKNLQDRQSKLGADAEKFVLTYEKLKRKNHLKHKNIKIISEMDTSAGYDIQSYKTDESVLLDKFIEVKSYTEKLCFYWSKHEIDTAKQKQDNYFLCLVNRDKMDAIGYEPLMIQNPYKKVLQNMRWERICQSWMFQN